MSSRRGFLKLIGAAPIALPVAAKEAAVSMGLSGPLGAGAGMANTIGYATSIGGPMPCDPASEGDYLRSRLAEIMSPQNLSRFRQEAKHEARMLDADIAAMRSISPSAAFSMQIERAVQKRIEQERSWIDQSIAKLRSIGHWV